MNTGKRLLVISKHTLDPKDAQAQQTRALLRALGKAGYTIDLITGMIADPDLDGFEELGGNVLPLAAHWHTTGTRLVDKVSRKLTRNIAAAISTHWTRQASAKAKELARKHKYAAVLSIGLPMESHVAALNAQLNAPWVAYLSDPWPESILPAPYSDFSIPLLGIMQRHVVSRVLQEADRVVCPCDEQIAYLKQHYPALDLRKTVAIPHVAPRLLRRHLTPPSHGAFRIVHAGSLSRERSNDALAAGLAQLPRDLDLSIRFIGSVHPSMIGFFKAHGVANRISLSGWLDKHAALEAMWSADALLLVEAEMDSYPFLPSKLADYSSCDLPVIAITGEASPSARIIKRFSAGQVARHVGSEIAAAFTAVAKAAPPQQSALHEYFSPENVARHYSVVFSGLPPHRSAHRFT